MKSALLALCLAFIIGLLIGPIVISILRRLKFGQTIREDGPKRHLQKAGTPAMGGIIFMIAFVATSLLIGKHTSALMVMIAAVLGFGAIGAWDDLLKMLFKRSLGLNALQKLIGQFIVAFVLVFYIVNIMGRGTDLIIPITGFKLELGIFYYLLITIFIVGFVNAVNLTDGLDGLASGLSFLTFLGYMLIALMAVKNPPIVGVDYHSLAIGIAAICGGCLAFLFYNRYPAKVFMGDTGSLALGGGLVILSVLTKTEVVLCVVGGIFLVEMFSVILQVASFRLTGKRIFRMSPLHHHFEMLGWKETRVVYTFYLVGFVFVLLGLLLVSL